MALPSDAIPLGQGLPADAIPLNQSSDMQDLMPVANNAGTTSIDTVPIKARAASGLANTLEGKVSALNKVSPELNAQIGQDGRIYANGKPFDLSPQGLGAFLYDLPGMISEATTKNIPLAANLAAAALTDGMSIPAQIALQAGATGTAEGLKELASQGLTSERPDAKMIALNAAMGAAGPVADQAFIATGKGMKALAGHLGNFVGPAKEIGPELLNVTSGIKLGVGEKVFQKMDAGEDLSKILVPENAQATRPSEILSNTFFGSSFAERTPENFINTLKTNLRYNSSDNVLPLKDMYEKVWGLSPQTIDTIIKTPTKDVINSQLFADNAPITVGNMFASKLAEVDDKMQQDFGNTLRSTINSFGKEGKPMPKVNIGVALDDMFRSGATPDINPTGIGIFAGTGINPGYTGESAKKVYGILLSKLKDNNLGLSKDAMKIFEDIYAKNPQAVPKDILQRMTSGGHFKEMTAPAAYKFLAEIKPLLDKTFGNEALSAKEKAPLAGFVANIRNQLGEISPEMKAAKQRYADYEATRGFFGNGKPDNLNDILSINNKMAQAYSNPAIRTSIGKLDEILGHQELSSMVDRLGASQEMKAFFDKSSRKMDTAMQGFISKIKGLEDTTAAHAQQNTALSAMDNLLPKDKRFLDPMWNHLIASDFQNKPLSIFKAKYLGLMALAATGMGHAGVLPALGVGLALSSPRNISKGLIASQKIKAVTSGATSRASAVASKAAPVTNRIVLNQLLQSAKKAKEASNRK